MNRALFKDTLREIRHSLGRFLSIFTIILLGVSFFSGLKATGPDMKVTADQYFDRQNLMDMRVVSSLGLDAENIEALRKAEGVNGVMPSYSEDVILENENRQNVIRLYSLPSYGGENDMNRPVVVEGRLPEKSGECAIRKGNLDIAELSIGDTVAFQNGKGGSLSDTLKTSEYTIVGIVDSPYYISFERGSSTIGNGRVNEYALVPESDFKMDVYTDAFVTVDGARQLDSFREEYSSLIGKAEDGLKKLGDTQKQARYDRVTSEAEQKIADAEQQLNDGKAEYEREIGKAEADLKKGEADLAKGKSDLKTAKSKYDSEVKKARQALEQGKKELGESRSQYEAALKEWNANKGPAAVQIEEGQKQLAAFRAGIDAQKKDLADLKMLIDSGTLSGDDLAAAQAQYTLGMQQVAAAEQQYQQQSALLDAKTQEYENTERTLNQTGETIRQGEEELQKQENALLSFQAESKKKFAAAEEELADAEQELADGQREYEQQKADGQREIADGEKELADAKQQLSDIDEPEWYVLDRDDNLGVNEYAEAADRMDAMAQVFPTIFFFIAAFVCLNTMTRMVDEQRTYIGTLKGIGYSKGAIVSKYILYAGIASVLGSVAGVLVGIRVFPTVIFSAYGIMYTLPPIVLHFYPESAVTSASLAVLVTTLTAYLACSGELRSVPATLMRPRAPKAGKRVWLERIKWIWNRLSFTRKVTMRNLFRYKKRFLMTVFGIAGSMALLLSGFGLQDSVNNIVLYQFNDIYRYQLIIGFEETSDAAKLGEITHLMMDKGDVEGMLLAQNKTVDIVNGNKKMSISLVTPENAEQFTQYVELRDRVTKKPVPFGDDGIILSEKMAKELGLSVGDTAELHIGETEAYRLRVSGITEHYAMHYAYCSPALYRKVINPNLEYNSAYAHLGNLTAQEKDALSRRLIDSGKIGLMSFTDDLVKNFSDMMHTLSYVVMVLIVSAGALAFLILYNLTNINVSERFREIATIKVLGFYDNEVLSYVYRENFILTGIGILLGLVLGTLLHAYIITTVEVDVVMFGRAIDTVSYVISCALTVLFALAVNFIMYFKLKKINMVEALKTVE